MIKIIMVSAYHMPDAQPSTFYRLFIFHNDLMRGRLVSCPPTKMTRLREAQDCRGHIAGTQCSWALHPAVCLHSPASLPRWGMRPHPRILSLEGLSAVIWFTFVSQFLNPSTKVACPPLRRPCLLLQFPLEGRVGGTQGSAGCFGDGSFA